ncbi:MAG: ABC transporter substrate-binding protein [Acidobacteriaceae bacterium]
MAEPSSPHRRPGLIAGFSTRALFALLTTATLLLGGCSGDKPPANTAVMLIDSSPSNLDPRVGTDAQSEHIDMLLFDSLVRHNSHFGFQPSLASSWNTPNPSTYIFHLRPGVRFSNGKPLTARDVKWTIESMLNGTVTTVKTAAYEDIAAIDTPDPLTVVIHLRQPDNALLSNLSDGALEIVPYGSGKNFGQHPVGSGPFEFVSQAYDRDVVIQRNPYYWGTKPHIERVRFHVVPDATTRALELEKGSADVEINSLPQDTVRALRADKNLRVISQPGTELYYIVFNLRDPILRHQRVRQAIAYAINRPLIIQSLFGGDARLASSLLPPEHWAWTPTPPYTYDPAKADQLLDEAGFPRKKDGIRFRIAMKTSTDETTRLMAMAIQAELAQVGIKMELRSFEFATFYSDLTRGAFQMAPSRWIGGNEQPDIFRYSFASSSFPPYGANRGYFHDPEVDHLIDEASTSPDRAVQIADYARIQQIVATQLPTFDLFYINNVVVHSTRLTNLTITSSPSGNFYFLCTARLRQ